MQNRLTPLSGGLSSAQMERMASPHGVGVHGDAVHVGGADTGPGHASAVELLRHRGAAETVPAKASRDAGGDLRTNGEAAQEASGEHSIPVCKAGD